MIHIRRQIREAIAGLFVDDKPETFARVETDRVHAIDSKSMLPCLEVSFEGEEIGERAARGEGKLRAMNFAVTVSAQTKTLADTLDDQALIVERKMAADMTLGGLVMHIQHTGTTYETSPDGEARAGALRLTYAALVMTPEGDASRRA
ncbi:hypothetical protein [Hoeflea sp.]|uniref:hypothetical protein n=1 Tax=Hoeflea sp. TaxID=1940281 RepID=UPI003B516E78